MLFSPHFPLSISLIKVNFWSVQRTLFPITILVSFDMFLWSAAWSLCSWVLPEVCVLWWILWGYGDKVFSCTCTLSSLRAFLTYCAVMKRFICLSAKLVLLWLSGHLPFTSSPVCTCFFKIYQCMLILATTILDFCFIYFCYFWLSLSS